MCARKYMFGDESTFGSKAKTFKSCPKTSKRKNIFYIQQGPITNLLIEKKVSHFTIPLNICTFLMEWGNETYTFYHLYAFQLKKACAFNFNRK